MSDVLSQTKSGEKVLMLRILYIHVVLVARDRQQRTVDTDSAVLLVIWALDCRPEQSSVRSLESICTSLL